MCRARFRPGATPSSGSSMRSACLPCTSPATRWGGWIALELAHRGTARSVVAISPAGLVTPSENRRSRRTLLALRAVARGLAPVAGALSRPAVLRAPIHGLVADRPWRFDPAEAAYAVRALAAAPGLRATLDWLFTQKASGLRAISCP
jgi:hypothetical protein